MSINALICQEAAEVLLARNFNDLDTSVLVASSSKNNNNAENNNRRSAPPAQHHYHHQLAEPQDDEQVLGCDEEIEEAFEAALAAEVICRSRTPLSVFGCQIN